MTDQQEVLMNIKIVNQRIQYTPIKLVDPSPHHFLHIGLEVDGFLLAFPKPQSSLKKQLVQRAVEWCASLGVGEQVVNASVFLAVMISPGLGRYAKEHRDQLHIPRFDVTILVEAISEDAIDRILARPSTEKLLEQMKQKCKSFYMITASNVRRIHPVDHSRQGVFLFNYFFAKDLERNLKIWEYSAGWFHEETGLDNSTVLLPDLTTPSQYTIINHCRWNSMKDILPSLLFKPSFRQYVLDNFYENDVAAIPILYKLANLSV